MTPALSVSVSIKGAPTSISGAPISVKGAHLSVSGAPVSIRGASVSKKKVLLAVSGRGAPVSETHRPVA